uniref:Uncharacterized protein n=1 Tax=Cacopsylla melanoneura TaxID=428564 RepID=A0A8D8Z6J2_9HEMI
MFFEPSIMLHNIKVNQWKFYVSYLVIVFEFHTTFSISNQNLERRCIMQGRTRIMPEPMIEQKIDSASLGQIDVFFSNNKPHDSVSLLGIDGIDSGELYYLIGNNTRNR